MSAHLSSAEDGLLLVLPVPFRTSESGLLCEEQATNGIDQWAEHFAHVTVVAPVLNSDLPLQGTTIRWCDPATLRHRNKVKLVPLPMAYTVHAFASSFARGRRILREQIKSHRYLSFAVGGLVGDWAALGARMALSLGLPYSIHTDRVEHQVLFRLASKEAPLRRIKGLVVGHLMRLYHRSIIGGCALGLWHGGDCFLAYSPWARENHLIHDIHLKPADAVPTPVLDAKLRSLRLQKLSIAYAGRMDPMKAPLDWLCALGAARDLGVDFEAVWLGDGPLHEDFHARLRQLGLEDHVRAPGFVGDRAAVLAELRRSHLFVFTHVTPESPRCLLEALVSGTPIVGYASAYAEDVTTELGGGVFVPIGDWQALGRKIAELDKDRTTLAGLVAKAAENGKRFNDEAVFRERSELIRKYS